MSSYASAYSSYFIRWCVLKVSCVCIFSLQDFYRFYEVIGLKWKVRLHALSHDHISGSVLNPFEQKHLVDVFHRLGGVGSTGLMIYLILRFLSLKVFIVTLNEVLSKVVLWLLINCWIFSFLTGIHLLVKSKAFQYAMCELESQIPWKLIWRDKCLFLLFNIYWILLYNWLYVICDTDYFSCFCLF